MSEKPKPDTREEVIEAILALVDDGKSLRQACKEIDFPRKTFEGWVDADEALAAQYERARTGPTNCLRKSFHCRHPADRDNPKPSKSGASR